MRALESSLARPDYLFPGTDDASGRTLVQGLSQHARLISIETSLGADVLVVERFSGREAISELFRFEVDCIVKSSNVELETLLGEEASLQLRLNGGNCRFFHGVVTRIQFHYSENLPRCRLTLEPWLQALTLRRDSYIFQDKTVPEIVADVLGDYAMVNYRFDVRDTLSKRSLAVQYRESDYDFLRRLLAEEGLNFYFVHDDGRVQSPAIENKKSGHARHQLILFDDNSTLGGCAQTSLRYQRADATDGSDAIVMLEQHKWVAANTITLGCWDYKKIVATTSEGTISPRLGDCPELEIFEGNDAYRSSDSMESARSARIRSESLALANQLVLGEGSARALASGTWFAITGHPNANGEFAALSVSHEGNNELFPETATLAESSHAEGEAYRNWFTCVPRTTQIRPPYLYQKPAAPGAQVALVVGVCTEEISTERNHRIKVQFPWQRGDHAAPGQLPHPTASNAPGNETAGTWVRVSEPSAGANWGANFVPRIGQEVCVDFISGDIDRPVVTGQLYNGTDIPSFHGADNHSGAISGIKTKEYAANGSNQWLIDDTPGQLGQTITASGSASQLNAGYLIHQNGNIRGAYRGAGFELATHAWSSLRAKRGIFLSTSVRDSAASTQLDTQETQGLLKAAADTAKSLSGVAAWHYALPLLTSDCLRQICETLNGSDSFDGKQAPVFQKPVALIGSQASVSAVTPASAVMHASQDMTMTAAGPLRFTGGQALTLAAAGAASLIACTGNVKAIAAKAPVSAVAHAGPMNLSAHQAVAVMSGNGNINMRAKQEILLSSGGGYIRLAGANIDIHCTATVSVKGSMHRFLGARAASDS